MPALPWVQREKIDPAASYQAMASFLPLTRHRSIPGFLADALAIRRQLARAEGLVGYALDAELARKTFWTFSVWKSRADLDRFARSDPHQKIINRLRPHMGESRFEFWSVPGETLPMTRDQMKAPLRKPPDL
jgi:heme-degrading monooxygenase HmoA